MSTSAPRPGPEAVIAAGEVTGVVLAGGRATRMGGEDKGLVELAGRPMVEHVLDALVPQVGSVLINANRNRERYAAYGYAVVADESADFQGPLAGMCAALARVRTPLALFVPCDSPLLPADLLRRLAVAMVREEAEIAAAFGAERLQPVFALIQARLLPDLRAYLAGGDRKIDRWYAQHRCARADFSDIPDTFINVNTPQERARLAARLGTR